MEKAVSKNILVLLKEIADDIEENGFAISKRSNRYIFYFRKDENLFFPASILVILKEIDHLLLDNERKVSQRIRGLILPGFRDYIKERDPDFFNFYSIKPFKPFPYGFFFSRFWKFALPCDADDTALAYLALMKTKDEIAHLKEEMIRRAEETRSELYLTWLGSDQMPKEYSLGVICNVLYLFSKHDLLGNQIDRNCIEFIEKVILSQSIMKRSFEVSIHYPTPCLNYYHISRVADLLGTDAKQELVRQIAALKSEITVGKAELVLLDTALLKLGLPVVETQILKQNLNQFSFFIASMMSYTNFAFLRNWARFRFFQIDYCSGSFNKILWIERLIWDRK